MDPAKLKVVELRAELSKRGLDTKGNKPVLVERLRVALEEERGEPKTHTETRQKVEHGSESEDEGSTVEAKSPEPAKVLPRTPSRSSRHSSREPVTPARTPTRRSSSRSSLSRQSPAKTMFTENEATSNLEPIVEEEKLSPKKVSIEATPKQETTPVTPKKETVPTTPKQEPTPVTPKQDTISVSTPKKECAPTTPIKENIPQNESPKVKKDERFETVQEEEEHVSDEAEDIIRKIDDICNQTSGSICASSTIKSIAESPTKVVSESPSKFVSQSPVKPISQSPVKPVLENPTKPFSQSPLKTCSDSPVKTVPSPVKTAVESPNKTLPQSPVKPTIDSPVKPTTPSPMKTLESPAKITESPVKVVESPAKVSESPAKVAESPVKVAENPVKTPVQNPVKSPIQSSVKSPIQSPIKSFSQSPVKPTTSQKIEQSPTKKEVTESPNNKLNSDESNLMQTEEREDAPTSESMEVDQENQKIMETDDIVMDEQQDKSSEEKSEDRKRKRSPSPHEEAPRAPPSARPENEPILDENSVLLSWYDSDLNLVIDAMTYCAGSPMQGDGFSYMWAGIRASYGFSKGKVFYEAKVTLEFDNLASSAGANVTGAIPADEDKIPSLMRVGWSTIGTSLQLGEDKVSYGYEGTGKKSTNKEFTEYGIKFSKNDVIGCYADFDTDENVTLTYTVNGETQGPAFVISKEELGGKALFPHILCKNSSFSVNLGQEDHWGSNILEGYQVVGKVDINDRIAGPRRPEKREDCEVILLCGLPFSGKTTWVTNHVAKNPEKMYCVLGTHNLIQRMTVDGAPLKQNLKGRWENVVEKCTRALNKLLDSAPSRRRNYILDQQANVYGSNQRRKMRNFYGFHRKAVVIVPTEEEYHARITKRKEESDAEEIRESSMLEVKANLSAPSVGESFEEVVWAELGEEEGRKLIEKYNHDGKKAGYGQTQQTPLAKRSRFDNGQKDRNNRDNRDHRRPAFNDRRSGSWRGGGSGGGGGGGQQGGGSWRDGGRMRGGPMRHGSGYGSNNWRGRGGSSMGQQRSGGNDRRQGNDRNRSSGRQGGWNAMGYQSNHGSGVWSQGSWQGQSQGNWSGGGQQGGSWNQQQQSWSGGSGGGGRGGGGSNSGNWKSYGQSNSGYDNGNWGGNNWGSNSQYYPYWGDSGQQAGQTSGSGSTQGSGGGQSGTKK